MAAARFPETSVHLPFARISRSSNFLTSVSLRGMEMNGGICAETDSFSHREKGLFFLLLICICIQIFNLL